MKEWIHCLLQNKPAEGAAREPLLREDVQPENGNYLKEAHQILEALRTNSAEGNLASSRKGC